ncbi:MAG: hypothetical protein NTY03_08695 [Candidatus Bathyarchaeota archaeon]|nr:hypothetical protein [Candidatus Bathyarchaeota archaeon]
MSKQVEQDNEKTDEVKKHLPYWAVEVLKLKEEALKQAQRTSLSS